MSRGALSDTYAPRILARLCNAFMYIRLFIPLQLLFIYIHVYIHIYTGHNMTQPYSIYTVYDMTQPYFLIPCSAMRTILSLLSGDSRTEDSVGSFLCATAVIKSTQFVKINCKWIFVFTDVSFCWRLYFMLVSYSTLYCSKCTSGK